MFYWRAKVSLRFTTGLAALLSVLMLAALDFGRGAGPARSAEETWTQVTLIYHSDGKGKIEPCG